MRHLFAALVSVAAVSYAPCTAALAGWQDAGRGAAALVLISARPLGQVLKAIERQIPGRALDARRIERDGRTFYSVKWLGDDGKVRVITVDAESGRIEQIR